MDDFTTIADIFLSIFMAIALVILFVLIGYSFVTSYYSERKYQKKVITILKGKCEYEVKKEQIRQAFATYLTKNSSYLNIVQLNLRLIEKLQEKKFDHCSYEEIGEFCKTLTDLNNDFNDEHLYNDEKLNVLLSITNNELLNEKIKSLFLCINSYYDGRIYEKDCVIQEQKRKMEKNKKAKIVSFIVGAVGFFSGIVTLIRRVYLCPTKFGEHTPHHKIQET